MSDLLQAFYTNPLLQSAILAALAASLVSGIIGTYVVIKRIVFIAGSIAHSVLGGIGLSLWLQRVQGVHWLSPTYGAVVAALISALLIGYIQQYYRQREDAVIATLWSMGMAIGVIFISQTPGANTDLNNFLTGNLLFVSRKELFTLILLDVVVLATTFVFYKHFSLLCFDEDQACLQGVPVRRLYLLLLALIALSVVLLVHVVGIILVITMLTLPATIANLCTQRLSYMMILAVLFSAVLSVVGTGIAYSLEWPPGGTIALFAGTVYLFALKMKSSMVKQGS